MHSLVVLGYLETIRDMAQHLEVRASFPSPMQMLQESNTVSYIYIYTHTFICLTYLHKKGYIHIYTDTYIHIYIYKYTYVCKHICVHMYVHMHVCTCVCI